MPKPDAESVEVASRAELREWLAENHRRVQGVWLVHFKKLDPRYLPWVDLVQECLCFGWVDSVARAVDELRTSHWISPRRAGSNWSAVNKKHVAALRSRGLMTEAGEAAVARAVRDGSWEFLDDVEKLFVPGDLSEALESAGSRDNYDRLPKSARRAILEWIKTAKRQTTRATRIAATAEAAAAGRSPLG